ncbi:MAG: SpoIIIAH-like family protein [Bacillota bacterium]
MTGVKVGLLVVAALALYWAQGNGAGQQRLGQSLPAATAVGESTARGDYFADARMSREKSFSRQLEELRRLSQDTSQDKAVRSQAAQELMAITDKYRKQVEIESQLSARGYDKTLVFINPGRVEVIIGKKELSKEEVARIGELVAKGAGVPLSSIAISCRQE